MQILLDEGELMTVGEDGYIRVSSHGYVLYGFSDNTFLILKQKHTCSHL
jgi:hypothetical protein